MKKLLVAGIAAAAFCGAPALAADMAVKAPPPPPPVPAPVSGWTGCYIGGNLGGAWIRDRQAEPDGTVNVDHTGSGFVGGGQIGCDYQLNNNWVIGIQGMWDGSAVHAGAHPNTDTTGTDTFDVHVNSFGTAAAELGFLINPTLEFYGKAGIGWIAENQTFNCPLCSPSQNPSVNSTRSGFDAGLGLTWMLQRNWDLFVEYDHLWLGTKNITYEFTPLYGPFPESSKESFDKVLVGVDYRFGGPAVAK